MLWDSKLDLLVLLFYLFHVWIARKSKKFSTIFSPPIFVFIIVDKSPKHLWYHTCHTHISHTYIYMCWLHNINCPWKSMYDIYCVYYILTGLITGEHEHNLIKKQLSSLFVYFANALFQIQIQYNWKTRIVHYWCFQKQPTTMSNYRNKNRPMHKACW